LINARLWNSKAEETKVRGGVGDAVPASDREDAVLQEYDTAADAAGSFDDAYAGVRGRRKAAEIIERLRDSTPHEVIRSISALLALGYDVIPPASALKGE
jgi:hypothetical protein